MNREYSTLPKISFACSDVRDVALAHMRAMMIKQAAGKFLLFLLKYLNEVCLSMQLCHVGLHEIDVLFKNHWTNCAHQKPSTRHIILICSEISVLAALAVNYNRVSSI